MPTAMRGYLYLLSHHPRALATLLVLTTGLACWQISYLQYDGDPRTLFRTNDGAYTELEQFFDDFRRDDLDCLIVLQSDDWLTTSGIGTLRQIQKRTRQIPGVQEITSVLDVRSPRHFRSYYQPLIPPSDPPRPVGLARARSQAADHPVLKAGLLSADRTTTVMSVRLSEQLSDIDQLSLLIGRIQTVVDEVVDSPMEVCLTGVPVLRVGMFEAMRRDQLAFSLIGAAASAMIAWLVFRDLSSVLTVMGGPTLGVLWTMGLLAATGQRVNFLSNVIPPIIMVVGVANSIHVLSEFRRLYQASGDRQQATLKAVRTMASPCGLAALTTGVGFGSLLLAPAQLIGDFAVVAAAGCGLSFLAVLSWIPLLTSSPLGDRVGCVRTAGPLSADHGVWAWLWALLRSHPLAISTAGVFITVLLAATAWGLEPDNRLTESAPQGEASSEALHVLDRTFGGSVPASVVVRWNDDPPLPSLQTLKVLEEVHAAVGERQSLGEPLSILSLVQSISSRGATIEEQADRVVGLPAGYLTGWVNTQKRQAVVRFVVPDSGAAALRPVFGELRNALRQIEYHHPGYQLRLTGTPVVTTRNLRMIIQTLFRSILLAAVVVFGIVWIFTRSLWLGALSIVPNLFPLAATSAVLWLFGGRLEITSVVVFSICLGVAADDTVHFLVRFQRRRQVGGEVQAVDNTFAHLAEVLAITTVVIACGFASVLVSQHPSLQLFGFLACVGLVAAAIGDLVILPALLLVMARFRRESVHCQQSGEASRWENVSPSQGSLLEVNKPASTRGNRSP